MALPLGIRIDGENGYMDWDNVRRYFNYAWIRAGIGNSGADDLILPNLAGANRVGIPFGVFVEAKLSKNPRTFAQRLAKETTGPLGRGAMILSNDGLSKNAAFNWLNKFINEWVKIFGDNGTLPVFITTPQAWDSTFPRNDIAKYCDLYIAHWTSADKPNLPADWGAISNPKTEWFWEDMNWSDVGDLVRQDGSPGDRMFGVSVASRGFGEFNSHYGVSESTLEDPFSVEPGPIDPDPTEPDPTEPDPTEPDPTEPSTDCNEIIQVREVMAGAGLNVRVVPEGTDIGGLPYGSQVGISELSEDGKWGRITGWVYIADGYTREK